MIRIKVAARRLRPREPAKATGFVAIIFAVVDAHDGSDGHDRQGVGRGEIADVLCPIIRPDRGRVNISRSQPGLAKADHSESMASIASRRSAYIGQTMSSEVMCSSSLARSDTPDSASIPPLRVATFQQRINSPRNAEPK